MEIVALVAAFVVAGVALAAMGALERRRRERRAEAVIQALMRLVGDVGVTEFSEARRALLSINEWPQLLKQIAGPRWPELERRTRELVHKHIDQVDREPGAYLAAMQSSGQAPRWIDFGEELSDFCLRAFAPGHAGLAFALDLVEHAQSSAGRAAAFALTSEAAYALDDSPAKLHEELTERAATLLRGVDDDALATIATDVAWLARELRDAHPELEAPQRFVRELATRLAQVRSRAPEDTEARQALTEALEWLEPEEAAPEVSQSADS